MKTATQIKALIRNMAREKKIDVQLLMRNYMMESLLVRVSQSGFHDQIILKGGMLIAAMIGLDLRSTMDMDTTLQGLPLKLDFVEAFTQTIITMPSQDNIRFHLKQIHRIREEEEYEGYRISLEANMDKMSIPMKIDMTTGDIVTPHAISFSYPMMLENRSIEVLAYNLETILSEKLESILVRGEANIRMRDLYDLHILFRIHKATLDPAMMKTAVGRTMTKRGTVDLLITAPAIISTIEHSLVIKRRWGSYQQQFEYAASEPFQVVLSSIRELLHCVIPVSPIN